MEVTIRDSDMGSNSNVIIPHLNVDGDTFERNTVTGENSLKTRHTIQKYVKKFYPSRFMRFRSQNSPELYLVVF